MRVNLLEIQTRRSAGATGHRFVDEIGPDSMSGGRTQPWQLRHATESWHSPPFSAPVLIGLVFDPNRLGRFEPTEFPWFDSVTDKRSDNIHPNERMGRFSLTGFFNACVLQAPERASTVDWQVCF